jgi:hypothetical protein
VEEQTEVDLICLEMHTQIHTTQHYDAASLLLFASPKHKNRNTPAFQTRNSSSHALPTYEKAKGETGRGGKTETMSQSTSLLHAAPARAVSISALHRFAVHFYCVCVFIIIFARD